MLGRGPRGVKSLTSANAIAELAKTRRELGHGTEHELLSGLRLGERPALDEPQQVSAGGLVDDALAGLVLGDGVELRRVPQRVAQKLALTMVEAVRGLAQDRVERSHVVRPLGDEAL